MLELLAHQLGEAALEAGEREHLAAGLTAVERSLAMAAASAGLVPHIGGEDGHDG
ncbi:MAG TPA: hypothetical protein VM347_36095 [Nonomuraea sp.]|nr:hypothetical protein [Nonomuraea sp.]